MREPENDPANCAGKRTQKQVTLKIRRQPWIASFPAVTPRSEVGVPFRTALRARGGSGIFAWSLASGRLPEGLRLFPGGSIGARHAPMAHTALPQGQRTRKVGRSGGTSSSPLPQGSVCIAGSCPSAGRATLPCQLTAVGGVGPIAWKVTRGRLPRGLRLESARGRLTGSPTEAGTHVFTVEARDGLKVTVGRAFRIVVAKVPRD